MLDKLPINFALMKEPANWAIVFLMVAIAGLGIAAIMPSASPSADS